MRLLRVLTALSMLTLLTLAASGAWSAGPADVRPPTNLGALLPGVNSFAVAVNDRGQVAGMAWDPGDPFGRGYPVVWEKGAAGFEAIALGTLAGPTWYDLSIPDNGLGPQRAINRESQVVGYSYGASRRPVIWRQLAPGAFVRSELPGLGTPRAINNLEQIIGRSSYWEGPSEPPNPLPVPSGMKFIEAHDINDSGQIVGQAVDANWRNHPLLWNPDGQGGFAPVLLFSAPDAGPGTFAVAINNHGTVVGAVQRNWSSDAVVWRWKSDHYEMVTLDLPTGFNSGWANGINDAGKVAGVAGSRAVLWEPDSSGVLRPQILPSEGFTGTVAATVNNRGQVVGYGWSCDPVGGCVQQALLWDVDTSPPTISGARANPAVLWPPNHKMVNVTVEYAASDESGSVDCALDTVTSNETLAASDWMILDAHHVELISERTGAGLGRTYTIPITCVDPSGNTATEPVIVTVPHDRR